MFHPLFSLSSWRRLLPLGILLAGAPLLRAQAPPSAWELVDALPGLTFELPLGLITAAGEKDTLWVVEKSGRIQKVTGLEGAHPSKQLFLDLTHPAGGKLQTEGECGLLGLALPPDFARSGRCFVYYSLEIEGRLHQRLSRFLVKNGQADPASEQPLWTQVDGASNHNGGDLHFGPEGYLYISVGDGGAANDKLNNARFITKGYHAGLLRIDVDKRPGSLPPNPHPGLARDASGAAFYAIPADNPFVGATSYHGQPVDPHTVRTEFWATGLRNPWRFTFDEPTGRLFAGDVGQDQFEEVDLITRGGDYGWSAWEGRHRFTRGPGRGEEVAGAKFLEPIYEYPHTVGISVTGGVVSRGRKLPELQGAYLFTDFGTGLVTALREKGGSWQAETLTREPGIAGLGFDPHNGDVLFANLGQGKIKRLQRAGGGAKP